VVVKCENTVDILFRFAAAVDLAMKLEGHPQKAAILNALERRRMGRIDTFFDNFVTELAVTGMSILTNILPYYFMQIGAGKCIPRTSGVLLQRSDCLPLPKHTLTYFAPTQSLDGNEMQSHISNS